MIIGSEAELLSSRFSKNGFYMYQGMLALVLSLLKHSVIQTKPNCLEVILLSLLISRCPVGMLRQINARVEKEFKTGKKGSVQFSCSVMYDSL